MTRLFGGFAKARPWFVLCALLTCSSARPAHAQLYESVGIRAQGMAGAFVAVADDATATWWNPAGLATGAFFSAIVEHRSGDDFGGAATAGVSIVVPSLGLSYYRLRITGVRAPDSTDSTTADRQDLRVAGIRPLTYVLSQFGATVGHSLGEHLVLGSTLKLVRADHVRGDLDVGAMGTVGSVRLAISVKDLLAPDLTSEGNRVGLDRQVRVGAAYVPSRVRGPSFTGSVDADLTTTTTAVGDERHLSGGFEVWVNQRVGLRGGASMNTVGDARRSVSAGASISAWPGLPGLYVEGEVTRGDDAVTKGWGVSLRVTF